MRKGCEFKTGNRENRERKESRKKGRAPNWRRKDGGKTKQIRTRATSIAGGMNGGAISSGYLTPIKEGTDRGEGARTADQSKGHKKKDRDRKRDSFRASFGRGQTELAVG